MSSYSQNEGLDEETAREIIEEVAGWYGIETRSEEEQIIYLIAEELRSGKSVEGVVGELVEAGIGRKAAEDGGAEAARLLADG